MPDPIAIIGVTALALSAAKTTKDFVDGIIDAPNAVTAVTRDLESLNTILTLLLTQLQDPVFKDVQALDPIVAMLDTPLKNCTEETEKLKSLLRPFVKPSGAAKTGKWTRFSFKYREADIKTIQQRLNNCRASLDAAVGIAVLIISARSSKNAQTAGLGIDNIQRRIQRLLLHAGLDSSIASTSSHAASEILESVDDRRIMDWLCETGPSADDDEAEDKDSVLWSPEIVIGIDVGTTCTGMAYSLASDFSRTIIFTQWLSHKGGGSNEKIETVVSYDRESRKLLNFGFDLDSYLDSDVGRYDWFLYDMDLERKRNFESSPLIARAKTFYTDFLSCLYGHLSSRLNSTLPGWTERGVEFVFSAPHDCTSRDGRFYLEELIRSAGFGAQPNHHVNIIRTEQAILSTMNLPEIPSRSTVLVCDAGGTGTHISVCRIATQPSTTILEVMISVTRYGIGSGEIDHYAQDSMEKDGTLPSRNRFFLSPFEASLLSHGRDILKCYWRDWHDFKHSYSSTSVAGPDFIIAPPELDLRMASTEVQNLFDWQSERLSEFIEEQIDSARAKHGLQVDYIVLSGGLGASPYIQWSIQEHFKGKIEVIVDAEAHTAATRGLVIQRLRELGLGQTDE